MKNIKNSEKIKQNLDKIEMLLKGVDLEIKDKINMYLWALNKDLENTIRNLLDMRE